MADPLTTSIATALVTGATAALSDGIRTRHHLQRAFTTTLTRLVANSGEP